MSQPNFSLGPTVVRTSSGHSRTYSETQEWIRPLLSKVPITRIHDASPLGNVALPVFAAITPFGKDLTVHAGKGSTPEAAWLSAAMEAIERISAEDVPQGSTVESSFEELSRQGVEVVNPNRFDLPYETQFDPTRRYTWVRTFRVPSMTPAWIAKDLVVTPPAEGILQHIETNGLASGNNHTEALVHALYEAIERDAISEDRLYSIHHDPLTTPARRPRILHHDKLPEALRTLVEKVVSSGFELVIRDLSNSIPVPVWKAVIMDRSFPGAEGELICFEGFGADLHPFRAIVRAITEVAQSHTSVLLGARDSFEGTRPMSHRKPKLNHSVNCLVDEPNVWASDLMTWESDDLYRDLHELIRRLDGAGLKDVYMADLTRADLGVPVVRALVPGLAMPFPDSSRRPGPRLLKTLHSLGSR